MPKVSICIPTYNQTKYLNRTLVSIENQDYNDYEIIITDDTRDDQIKNFVHKFNFKGKLKYYKNKNKLGSPENWNESIRKASGEYIKIIHHDDFLTYKYSLSEFVKMLDENPDADFAFSSSLHLNSSLEHTGEHIPTAKQIIKIKKSPYNLFCEAIVGAPSATIFRNNKNYHFDRKMKWHVDIDFYINILKHNRSFVFNPSTLISTIAAENRVTNECFNNKQVEIYEMLLLYKKLSKNLLFDLKFLHYIFRKFVYYGITTIKQVQMIYNEAPLTPLILIAVKLSNIYQRFYGKPGV